MKTRQIMRSRTRLGMAGTAVVAAMAAVLTAPGAQLSTAGAAPPTGAPDQFAGASTSSSTDSSHVVRDWERTSIRTVYTENLSPVPIGVPYLGFTSLSMYDAARTAQHRGHASAVAAVAQAAHDVLAEYFPASAANLEADLATSLAGVPDGMAKNRGVAIGTEVANDLIEDRADDGRGNTSIVYSKPPAPGIWQPPPTGMLAPWLGFVDLLVLNKRVAVNGPDPIGTARYAVDYQEVKRTGAATGADRTQYQSDTAVFFNSNSAIMVSEALLRYLDDQPLSLRKTARMFAVMHSAMTDSVITCWRLKYDVGFWRPFQAIQGAATDGNPATVPDPSWTPFLATPPYADYVSGHASATAPAIETIRRMLGEETQLTLHSYNTVPYSVPDRTYSTLSEIEFDAFHARIWGGFHFRDAMEDGYYIGHTAAQRVLRRLH